MSKIKKVGAHDLYICENVAFWYVHKQVFLANPADAAYLRDNNSESLVPVGGFKYERKIATELWEKIQRIMTPLLPALRGFHSHKIENFGYWQVSEIPYFGIKICHSHMTFGQHRGNYEQTREQFLAEMAKDRSPWATLRVEEQGRFKLVASAGGSWMIALH